ncbi:MAG: hypothetical protein LJE87_08365 [Deltaproteobacteria bacterium]|nr:hypothetical protein [Deltaproteobacteria bacterium]
MKCPKCGNVSFDHLDNCMKCSRDLSADRNELNLLDFRPEVPFLLGSLVGEMQGGGVQQDLSFTQETEIELGGLNMGEPPATEGSIDMPGAGSSEELSLSEIAMDDLETIEASALGDAAVEELELGDLAELSGEEADQAEEDDGFLGLEFEEDEPAADDFADLDEALTSEPAADPGDALELDLNEDDLSALAKELEDQLDSEEGGKK